MSKFSLYTVYDNRTDEPVAIEGTAEECAEKMGMKLNSFYANIWHGKQGDRSRWVIIKSNQHDNLPRNTFGDKIRYHRIMKGLTVQEMAKKVNVSACTLSLYENGHSEPSLFIACCIADLLGLSLDYLAGRTNKA